MKEGAEGEPRALIVTSSLEPLLGTRGTFGLVTRKCLELPNFFFFAMLCDVLKVRART
jgi:hypothetical protein